LLLLLLLVREVILIRFGWSKWILLIIGGGLERRRLGFFILFINNFLEFSILLKKIWVLLNLLLFAIKWRFLHIIFPFLIKLFGFMIVLSHNKSRGLLSYSLMHNFYLFNFFFSNLFIRSSILHLSQDSKVPMTRRSSIIDFGLKGYFFQVRDILL
jgi:hypothetical protein